MEQTTSYQKARKAMVERQLIPRGIQDRKVLDALGKVERHRFIPETLQGLAYADRPLPIDRQQTISQPYIVALMSQALEVGEDDVVLEIGTGSGYQAAILAEICKTVYTVEKYPELLDKASSILRKIGYKNVIGKIDDGTLGWPEHQPYDAIIVTAGAPNVPQPLIQQLKEGGRMVVPVGSDSSQEMLKLTRKEDCIAEKRLGGCRFVPLRGEHGWK